VTNDQSGRSSKAWRVVGFIAGLATVLLGGLLLAPAQAELASSTVVGAIFDNRWVIGMVRLLGVSGAAYLVASIAARVWHGQWAMRIGPVEVAVSEVADDQEDLQTALDRANATIADLEERLEAALALNATLEQDDGPGTSSTGGAGGATRGGDGPASGEASADSGGEAGSGRGAHGV
jgi:hypothetical protein